MLTLDRLKKVLSQSRQYNLGRQRFGGEYKSFSGEAPLPSPKKEKGARTEESLEIPVERTERDTSK